MIINYPWILFIIPAVQIIGVYIIVCIGAIKSGDKEKYLSDFKTLFLERNPTFLTFSGVAIFFWGISFYFFFSSIFFVNKYHDLIQKGDQSVSTVSGLFARSSTNECLGVVDGVPFIKYCRGVSPIKCINSKIHRRYLDKRVMVWFIKYKEDSRTYRGDEVPINCVLKIEFVQ